MKRLFFFVDLQTSRIYIITKLWPECQKKGGKLKCEAHVGLGGGGKTHERQDRVFRHRLPGCELLYVASSLRRNPCWPAPPQSRWVLLFYYLHTVSVQLSQNFGVRVISDKYSYPTSHSRYRATRRVLVDPNSFNMGMTESSYEKWIKQIRISKRVLICILQQLCLRLDTCSVRNTVASLNHMTQTHTDTHDTDTHDTDTHGHSGKHNAED